MDRNHLNNYQEGHVRVTPAMFLKNPARSLGGDALTMQDGRRISNDYNSSQ